MSRNSELGIPETNREIGIHLVNMQEDINDLNIKINSLEGEMRGRRFKVQDMILGGLMLPILCGIMLIILTKGLDAE